MKRYTPGNSYLITHLPGDEVPVGAALIISDSDSLNLKTLIGIIDLLDRNPWIPLILPQSLRDAGRLFNQHGIVLIADLPDEYSLEDSDLAKRCQILLGADPPTISRIVSYLEHLHDPRAGRAVEHALGHFGAVRKGQDLCREARLPPPHWWQITYQLLVQQAVMVGQRLDSRPEGRTTPDKERKPHRYFGMGWRRCCSGWHWAARLELALALRNPQGGAAAGRTSPVVHLRDRPSSGCPRSRE